MNMSKSEQKILYVTAGGDAPYALANHIYRTHPNLIIAREKVQSKAAITYSRARSKGWLKALGQLGTMVFSRMGKSVFFRVYKREISERNLDVKLDRNIDIVDISTPNSSEFIDLVKTLKPNIIFLSGCRIISQETLTEIDIPILNYHAGINPKYRGMFGGYWSRRNGDVDNYGTTVHLVDAGVDTGDILYQSIIPIKGHETMLTDAIIQVTHSMDISLRAIDDVCNNKIVVKDVNIPSQLWFQPTLWSYIWCGITKNIW